MSGFSQSALLSSFHKLLQDPQGKALFHKFLQADKATKLLSFYNDVCEFQATNILDKRLEKGKNIYTRYIAENTLKNSGKTSPEVVASGGGGASQNIPLPQNLKTELDNIFSSENIQQKVTADTFDKALEIVCSTMREDHYKRFLRSEEHQEYQASKDKKNDTLVLCKLPGEILVQKPLRVYYYDALQKIHLPCNLYVTNYRLSFGTFSNKDKANDLEKLDELESIPTKNPQIDVIDLYCRDFRKIEFYLEPISGQLELTEPLLKVLRGFCFPKATTDLFCFSYKPTFTNRSAGNVYNVYEEFLRQKINFGQWRFTNVNHDYQLCNTYPSTFVVPVSVTDEQLTPVFAFRSKGRIPILVWSHPTTGASITRSSQPSTGVFNSRCPEDENLAVEISNNSGGRTLHLLDARPRANALANTAKGKGFERAGVGSFYPNCCLEFLGIANIHGMRDSLQKVESLALSTTGNESNWLSNLSATNWFDHVRDIMSGVLRTVELVESGSPVLLHCSDGWDRTAQLCSLALLICDPYHRTLVGFEVLIEKEWLSAGHRFQQRIGHGDKNYSDQQRSPVFLQFLDCVYQIFAQFPCHFEFNENFLITIVDHLYSCQFGTFLYNSEQERLENSVKEKTTSLWAQINSNLDDYTNPFYVPGNPINGTQRGALTPEVRVKELLKQLKELKDLQATNNATATNSTNSTPTSTPTSTPENTETNTENTNGLNGHTSKAT